MLAVPIVVVTVVVMYTIVQTVVVLVHVSNSSEVSINIRNQFVNKNCFKSVIHIHTESTTCRTLSLWTLTLWSLTLWSLSSWTRTHTHTPHSIVSHTISHNDDKWLDFAFSNKIVHYQVSMTLS